ncbi:hypothetical protein [Halorussus aquaticus]|uniref:DUF2892 domain-containing protein n=1 Tax=Halorussus aquaticus TaxID=2953748 RepID=A0ABD5Q750_9EURY|nr:hypothetical protein [Halorussus aquaticus]
MSNVNRNGRATIGPTQLRLIIGIAVVTATFTWLVAPADSRLLVAAISGLVSLVATTLLLK